MKKPVKRRTLLTGLLLMIIMLLCSVCVHADEEAAVEQVVVCKPLVRVDYRGAIDQVPSVFLDGEQLTQQNQPVRIADSNIGIEYYVLLDISGSISTDRFENIKASLQQFIAELRENDRLVLYTFGDSVQKILAGEEDRESAVQTVASLTNGDMNTALFDAMNQAASEIEQISDDGMHRLIICISDGEDFADNTHDAQTVSDSISSKGIPVYTVAVEKKEETEEQARTNRSSFSAVAINTGGVPWTVDQLPEGVENLWANSVLNGLNLIRDTVLNTNHMELSAASNQISMKLEDLVLRFPDGKELTKKILVSRHIADDQAPSVTDVSVISDNEIRVSFSKPVAGAEKTENYKVSGDHTLAVSQVVAEDSAANTYSLVLGEKLTNGNYTLQIQNVTDNTQEKNPLQVYSEPQPLIVAGLPEETEPETEPKDVTVPTVTGIKASEPDGFEITFSEPVSGAEINGNYSVILGEKDVTVAQAKALDKEGLRYKIVLSQNLENGDYTIHIKNVKDQSDQANALEQTDWAAKVQGVKQKTDVTALLLKWWPLVLTIVVLILLLIMILNSRRMKKNKVTLIEGVAVEKSHVNKKVQVNIGDTSKPREVMIEIDNGTEAPKKVPYTVRGSLAVGRSKEDCDIFCNDAIMSRKHFRLILEQDGRFCVEDLGSRNGTRVNGEKITQKTEIRPGDDIQAGKMHFRVTWTD